MKDSGFNKRPFIELKGNYSTYSGWDAVIEKIKLSISSLNKTRIVVAVECYHGVYEEEIFNAFTTGVPVRKSVSTKDLFKSPDEIKEMLRASLTDDPVFGVLTDFTIYDYFENSKLEKGKNELKGITSGVILLLGTGAVKVEKPDILIYADMARWEIQLRFRSMTIPNLGMDNNGQAASLKYKQAFFIDWRVCDRLKKDLFDDWDFFLDTNDTSLPKMISGDIARRAMEKYVSTPFELLPYFDPGPWGGQWMKEVCNLDKKNDNYAWCFNCVPEENSILIKLNDLYIEMPAINLVFYKPLELLGKKVYEKFGAEFPIRFDFLDTMQGGNLSLQVHPNDAYIKEKFNWPYTQDESYYLIDAEEGAQVYLGLKENISKSEFEDALYTAQNSGAAFPDEKFIKKWNVKKHDHVLIPGGTVHCSGKGCMVLEISSTPYIFTFKLWDWGRMGLDGTPRPISINHGMNVIQFDRTTGWVRNNLINRIETVNSEEGLLEERTGLHELEFIETRRYRFSKTFILNTEGTVNVFNLVEGEGVIVESPDNMFTPLKVNFAETFVVPANVTEFKITPCGSKENINNVLIRAYVR